MRKTLSRGMKTWGHYLLALLCAATILLSAAWTREQRAGEQENRTALSDQSQRLSQAASPADPPALLPPTAGKAVRSYSETPVFFSETGVWQVHLAVDVSAETGETVRAMAAGTVAECGENEVTLDHGDGWSSRYRGLEEIAVRVGQRVRAGDALGSAGAPVPYEGGGHVCVAWLKDQTPSPIREPWAEGDMP